MKISYSPTYAKNPLVTRFVESLPQQFEGTGKTIYSDRNVIKTFTIDRANPDLSRVVVKRYKLPNLIQRIAYSFFRASKAERAFHNASVLRERGIDTPHEIAFLEEKRGGLLSYCYLVTGFDGAPGIEKRMTEPTEFDRIMAADFARFAAELHAKGILHNDLNCSNVLYHPHDGHYQFSVIDINRMELLPSGTVPSDNACMENLTRFCRRMDLFAFVAYAYATARHWPQDKVDKMIRTKKRHDIRRKWRKRLLHPLKGLA